MVGTLKGDVQVIRGGKWVPRGIDWAYTHWLKSEAEINVLIGNRENRLN